ncbi:head-tail connector protein [Fundicoccus sp. Sow4_H7]|uniref:Phage gp6-like head-tail connector protein n=2 Tax=Aerococcaceae TaxID=186827 RepID=A0A839A3Q1_9LACT|nr:MULTISPECIES: head-tail connector protein [Lactobacillales]MBA5728531.1 phage gp6-like head-tail connector protein [Ruoffia halotolerans]MBG9986232.1 phage gp6-like head-tail connector protein [Facklamia lactis]MDE1547762.1 head-tail connector protein [Jeotgalibaca caeni]
MVVSLEEAKLFLRVENEVEDSLITQLIQSSQQTVENTLRHSLTEYDEVPADIIMAILYGVAYLYENRETADFKSMIQLMRAILFPYRNEVF